MLDDVHQYMCSPGHAGRISRIPNNLREVDTKAYEPYFISIGPYHKDKPAVQPMERRKWMVLKYFLQVKPEVTLKDYLKELQRIEPLARSFYSDIEMDNKKFLQMLLLDSLYIVATFCGMPNSDLEKMHHVSTRIESIMCNLERSESRNHINKDMGWWVDDEIIQSLWDDRHCSETMGEENDMTRMFFISFEHDLFLLENQLPFFVLQKVYVLTYDGSESQFLDIVKDRFSMRSSACTILDTQMLISPTEEVHHLLHICHLFFRPSIQHKSCQLPQSSQLLRLGSAMQLHEACVTFQERTPSQHKLLDITFGSSGKMIMPCLCVDDNTNSLLRNLLALEQMPCLCVDDNTNSLLRNLIALEQMKYPNIGLDVSAYAVLLLHLETTPDDARFLRNKGIIQHHLASDKEMMYLVNKLSVGLSFDYDEDNYSLKPVFKELKRYTERRGPRLRAWLTHRYFNNAWMMISLVAATMLLILSVVQTFYPVYSYYHPYFVISSQHFSECDAWLMAKWEMSI